jgi:putative dehydrogenase
MRCAVIGLGAMGMGVAKTLLGKGFAVTGCDPKASAREAFAAAGGHAMPDVAALAPDALDALVLLVVNAAQVESVLFGEASFARALRPGTLILQSTTVPPGYARDLGERLEALGLLMLDAPVSGGAAAAAEGRLTVMASGPAAAFTRAEPLLAAIAAKTWRLGEAYGAGSTVKMVNQLLAGVHIAAAAEALALGIRAGADPETLFEVISTSAGSSWMWQNRVPHILAGDDRPLSAVNIFVKDLGIVLDEARRLTFPLPLAASAHQLFLAAAAHGEGDKDDAFVIRVFEALTGIPLPAAKSASSSSSPA